MVARRLAGGAAIALACAGGARAESAADHTSYLVMPLRSALAPSAKVGARRAGLICAPNGALRWSEVTPDPERAAALVARVLRETGLNADVPADDRIGGDPPPGERRVIGDVTAAEAGACTKQAGVALMLGSRRTIKGRGRIAIRWRIHETGARRPAQTFLTCSAFEIEGDANDSRALLDRGVAASARDLADALGGGARQPSDCPAPDG